jgi:hypothetical protein
MRRLTAIALVLALALSAVVALSGCAAVAEKATQAAVEKATGVKVDQNSGTITTTDKDGNTAQMSASEGTYPDGFPADFPKYNGVVDSALKTSTNGKDAFTVIVKTPDAAKTVYDYYLTELEKSGWKVDQKMDGTSSDSAFASISALKGDLKAGVTLSRSADETATGIMIGIGPKTQ